MAGLLDNRVAAKVKDLDHYRIHGGMAIETDYIISVKSYNGGKKTRPEPDFEGFTMSKTFNSFRTLADQLNDAADAVMSKEGSEVLPRKVKSLANYCQVVMQLIDSQRTQYLGKVNYMYVKVLAKQRSQILTDVLDATLSNFPDEIESHPFLAQVASIIEAFFLTDHCESVEDEADDDHISSLFVTPIKKNYQHVDNKVSAAKPQPKQAASPDSPDSGIIDDIPPKPQPESLERNVSSPVVPYTRKVRRSQATRDMDEKELNSSGSAASLLLDDDRSASDLVVPSYDAPVPTVGSSLETSALGTFIDNNPIIFMGIFAAAMQFLRYTGGMVVTVDLDVMLLVAFASFCLGLHTPRPMVGGVDKPPLKQKRRSRRTTSGPGTPSNAAKLLRKSMLTMTPPSSRNINAGRGVTLTAGSKIMEEMEVEVEDGEDDLVVRSPMPRFPDDAELGSILNCWSDPPCDTFKVRGEKYLSDKKKVKSGPYLFKTRGIDLFLTDACPENVGRISSIMGGELRDVPTFIINFRLPWGVLLFYFEIPERFLPFIKGCYNDPSVTRKELEAKMKSMNNQDRCCARFLLGDDDHKNNTLKIFPGVVEGPWVAKSVIGGKPAIIGTKLPVNYVYEPEGKDADGKKQSLYLEADLDIVSSSAARGILSVVRTYTQDLTIDLGFGIQGNSDDELPEQMLTGTRLHGLDPLNAPPLPPMKDMLFMTDSADDDDDDTERGDD